MESARGQIFSAHAEYGETMARDMDLLGPAKAFLELTARINRGSAMLGNNYGIVREIQTRMNKTAEENIRQEEAKRTIRRQAISTLEEQLQLQLSDKNLSEKRKARLLEELSVIKDQKQQMEDMYSERIASFQKTLSKERIESLLEEKRQMVSLAETNKNNNEEKIRNLVLERKLNKSVIDEMEISLRSNELSAKEKYEITQELRKHKTLEQQINNEIENSTAEGKRLKDEIKDINKEIGDLETSEGKGFFGQVAGAFGNIFKKMGNKLKDSVMAVSDEIDKRGGGLKGITSFLFSGLKNVTKGFAGTLGKFGGKLAKGLGGLAASMGVMSLLMGALTPIMEQLKPIIETLASIFADIVLKILEKILPAFLRLFARMFPLFAMLVNTLLPPVLKVLGFLLGVLGTLINVIAKLIYAIGDSAFGNEGIRDVAREIGVMGDGFIETGRDMAMLGQHFKDNPALTEDVVKNIQGSLLGTALMIEERGLSQQQVQQTERTNELLEQGQMATLEATSDGIILQQRQAQEQVQQSNEEINMQEYTARALEQLAEEQNGVGSSSAETAENTARIEALFKLFMGKQLETETERTARNPGTAGDYGEGGTNSARGSAAQSRNEARKAANAANAAALAAAEAAAAAGVEFGL